MSAKKSEAEIAARVVRFLEESGLDVYQEVEVSSGVADIVAVNRGCEVWIVEVKRTWSWDLMAQCLRRKRSAHRVFAAAPAASADAPEIAAELGIGTIRLLKDGGLRVEMAPRVSSNPRHAQALRRSLKPEHKTSALAGAPSAAGRWTAFRATVVAVQSFVTYNDGATMKEMMTKIVHHYRGRASAARGTMAARIRSGLVPFVEARTVDGVLRVYTTDASKLRAEVLRRGLES